MNSHTKFAFYIALVFLFVHKVMGSRPLDTTLGFVSQPLNESNFEIQNKVMWSRPLDTTLGFVSQPLDKSNFEIQKPYDLPVEARYSFSNDVHKLWVFSTDKPFLPTSDTLPRSEIRIRGYDYSSGVWQFEAYVYVPSGTNGVSIMQIFGSKPSYSTTTMLRVYDGRLYYIKNPVLLADLYNKWFRLNVIHDVDGNNVKVYIDGILKRDGPGRGGPNIQYYFKCGVYMQEGGSSYMESQWRDIKIYKRQD